MSRPDKGSVYPIDLYRPLLEQAGVTAHKFVYAAETDLDFIMSNDKVRGVTFTGSCPVGKHISNTASKYFKPALTELGGSDPFVVLSDADLELAIKNAVFWRTFHAGQVCVSPKRMIVAENLFDKFVDGVVNSCKQIEVGKTDPNSVEEAGTGFSPMSRPDLRDKVHDQVQRAVKHGDQLLTGGNKVGETYYEPTVLKVRDDSSPAWREEIFGPVFVVRSFSNEGEALSMANDTEYGLSASVYSQDEQRGLEFAKNIESGMVHLNDTSPSDDPCLAFGGNKNSGMGRNNFRFFTNQQSFMIHKN